MAKKGYAWQRGWYAWQRGWHAWQKVGGGMHGRGHVWQRGMRGRGYGWQLGVHGKGGGMHGREACVAEGYVWQGAWWQGMHAGETVIEAGGTHPTGMHSCF